MLFPTATIVAHRMACFLVVAGGAAVLVSCGKSDSSSQSSTEPVSARLSAPARGAGPASVEIVTKSGIEMVYLPGGQFMMGSAQGNPDERPPHRVQVGGFLMDKFEVTHERFAQVQL